MRPSTEDAAGRRSHVEGGATMTPPAAIAVSTESMVDAALLSANV
jgi:hypothetical protein